MKSILTTTLFGILALSDCAGMPAPVPTGEAVRTDALRAQLLDPEGGVMVVAHRACWADSVPENSLAAIGACIELGADVIEIDVALSADGFPVLMHDQTVDRMTEATGSVSEFSIAQLASLNLKAGEGGDAKPVTSETVPTLRAALARANGNILVNLDVKGEAYAPAFAIVEELGMGDQIIMKMAANSDDPALVGAPFLGKTLFMPIVRQCLDDTPGRACAPVLNDAVPEYDRYEPVAYEITFVDLNYFFAGVPAMQARKKRIWVNTLEPRHAAGLVDAQALAEPDAVWGLLTGHGANMIQTDKPRELIEYLKSQGLREDRSQ